MGGYQAEADILKSEFNFAIDYLKEANRLLTLCHKCASDLELYQWFLYLGALGRHFSVKMTDKQKIWRHGEMVKIINLFKVVGEENRGKHDRQKVKADLNLYLALDSFEEELIFIADKKGLLLKTSDDPGEALNKY
jgi:hypothetical protein